jgi:hypothetical protein
MADKVASTLEPSLPANASGNTTGNTTGNTKRVSDTARTRGMATQSTTLDRARTSGEVASTSAAHARVIAAAGEPSALVRTMIFPLHAALAQSGQIRELSWNHSDLRSGRFASNLNRGLLRRPVCVSTHGKRGRIDSSPASNSDVATREEQNVPASVATHYHLGAFRHLSRTRIPREPFNKIGKFGSASGRVSLLTLICILD